MATARSRGTTASRTEGFGSEAPSLRGSRAPPSAMPSTARSAASHATRAPARGLTAAAKAAAMLTTLEEKMLDAPPTVSERCKQEDIVRAFQKAGDAYRIDGKWRQAAQAYSRCGDAMLKLDRFRAAAAFYVDAARAMHKVDPESAIKYYSDATQQYAAVGYWRKCANLQVTIAELYEKDGAFEDSAEAYQSASDYFVSVGMYPQAVRCLLTSAAYLADQDAFELAAEKFDNAVSHCLDHNLLKLNAPSIMLDACLCWICVGSIGAMYRQVDDYSDVDYNFAASRERRFLLDIAECCKFYDIDEFIDHVWNFDYAVKLKPYQLRMMERIFRIIEAGAPEMRALLLKKQLAKVKQEAEALAAAE